MTMRIECDFRHMLAEPRITPGPDGHQLALTHGPDTVIIGLSDASLSALWMATTLALSGPEGS